MERRRKPSPRVVPSRLTPTAASTAELSLPNIEALIEDGEITIGTMQPVGAVAVATDGHNALAMLRRRDGETLVEILVRLDAAIGQALDGDDFTDEVNSPTTPSRKRR